MWGESPQTRDDEGGGGLLMRPLLRDDVCGGVRAPLPPPPCALAAVTSRHPPRMQVRSMTLYSTVPVTRTIGGIRAIPISFDCQTPSADQHTVEA